MKLTLIGGGGVRGPLFVASCLARAERIGLTEIALLDIRPDHLDAVLPLAQEIARRDGSRVHIVATTDTDAAIKDASYVVTTIRVGGDDARILDERIALGHGVLGQETTGPGGFAMAARTIPVALRYAELIDALAPDAWTFNFSNPAGLVTQALRDAGHERVIGICDGANSAQAHVAEHLGLDPDTLQAEVFGLNHLSWCRSVRAEGRELLQPLLSDPAFRRETSLGLFASDLVSAKQLWLNEYLYYFYYAQDAIAEITSAPATRGEEVRDLNQQLLDEIAAANSVDEALEHYYGYQRRRIATYMPYARADAGAESPHRARARELARHRIDEGYAGVALTVIDAFASGTPITTALNVPNQGAIDGLSDNDVVEVTCSLNAGTVEPIPIGVVPEPELALISAVKSYERQAAEAIRRRSRTTAVDALMTHPLVVSYPRAKALVEDYLDANAELVGTWSH